MSAAEPLQIQGLRFAWPGEPPLIDGLDLTVEPGRITALVGASGSGKSTVLRLVAGLLAPQGGRLGVPAGGRGFVFQSPTLLPWRTVAENVGLPLELAGRGDPRAVAAALDLVGLSEAAARLPWQLSGGMQMRASLARALVTQPSLLLLDEPFAALDPVTRRRLRGEFLRLWSELGFTALLVSHDIDEALLLSHRVAVLAGRPARLALDLPVSLPWPREEALRFDPALGALASQVEGAL